MMYPLLLKAPVKDYLWGGTRLKHEFGFECETERAAEAWLISCNIEGESIVKNGELSGFTLGEVLEKWGGAALGANVDVNEPFPIMLKLIDAKDRLSLHINPSDTYAKINDDAGGRTEMWYIVDCEKDAKIIYGLNRALTRDELRHRIKTSTLAEVCNFVPVSKGDVFHIEPGMLHAIGKGMLVAEVLQNSDVSYRVTDYGRLGENGKPRALHTEKAIEAASLYPANENKGGVGEITLYPFGIVKNLDSCDKFSADLLELNGKAGLLEKNSFLAVVMLDGEAVLSYPTGNMRLIKGDNVFVPANTRITLTGTATVLTAHV